MVLPEEENDSCLKQEQLVWEFVQGVRYAKVKDQ